MGWSTRMRELPVADAVGTVLCHDVTRIIRGSGPDRCKGALFRKGHIIRPEDVEPLRSIGKEHLYVFDLAEGLVHEEEAALRVARAVSGPGVLAGAPGLLAVSQDEVERVVSLPTSGTSGRPKRLFYFEADLMRTLEFFRAGMAVLCRPGDVALVLLPGRRAWGADVPVAAPSQLLALLGLPAEGFRRVRAVLSSAEPLPPGLRRCVEAAWNCEVFDHWGMTETGFGGGVECAAHAGYHLREADLLIEVADPATGVPLREGRVGEVLVTTLGPRAMPLVRYRTGDAGRWLPGPCPCGGALRRLGRVPGRLAPAGRGVLRPAKGGARG